MPKAIRESLGLHEGSRLNMEVVGGRILAEPQPDPVHIDTKDGFPVIRNGPKLQRGAIIEAIKVDRDRRDTLK